jgi:hypothetical protein
MQGTKKMGTRPTPSFYTSSVKQPTALLNFLYKFAEFIDLVSIRIHSTFIDWSPAFAYFRPLPLSFVALFRKIAPHLSASLWLKKLCRQTATSMPQAETFTPGKPFFFTTNVSMPPD